MSSLNNNAVLTLRRFRSEIVGLYGTNHSDDRPAPGRRPLFCHKRSPSRPINRYRRAISFQIA